MTFHTYILPNGPNKHKKHADGRTRAHHKVFFVLTIAYRIPKNRISALVQTC